MEDNKDQIQGEETIIIADDLNSNHTVDPEQVKKFYKHRFISACKIFKAEDGELVVLNFPDSIENRLVEKLIERMKEERFIRDEELINDLKTPNVCIGGPNVSVSPFIKEPLPQFIKDMYKLPFDLDTFKTPSCKAEVPREEMEEFNKSDLQLLREFFAREWKAMKELWKTWRSK